MWGASAGGSAVWGDSPLDYAMRELAEESGTIDSEKSFTKLSERVEEDVRALWNKYLCVTACDKGSVTLREGETIA